MSFWILTAANDAFSFLVFMSTTGRGFQVDYPTITLHAISRAEAGPSVYCQLDEPAAATEAPAEDEDASSMRELVILPKDPSSRMPVPSFPLISASTHIYRTHSRTHIRELVLLCIPPPRSQRRRRNG